ncbi:MAG: 50S ribosomal protein L24 [Elusimicrobia bacterium CG1_02_37_114]|nr:MAG: 50S ribosomal protein L24 [Elusimicrobia bacterium CG1_02_37_114]PIV52556.1 MAG: 50S ribosomal protein L24 [Elusimicrobia bacterium CG02_land_8_20_14_3_00_37_13]PIZ13285.1 MAG: 50S ribosomal protein L24 [Elusimicrobia bacterium CG_4_10_14_0_8_um_filter_37_32]
MLPIRKKDKVVVITGKDRGKRGEVVKVEPTGMRVFVSKINIIKKHSKPTQTDPGGIKEIEAAIHISNVMLVCPKCEQPTRPRFDSLADGKKVRACRKCGEMIV